MPVFKQKQKLESFFTRLWLFVIKPFQIARVLELLYALNWIWLGILSLLPEKYVEGSFFVLMESLSLNRPMVTILTIIIAGLYFIALSYRLNTLRQLLMMLNIGMVLWIAFRITLTLPIASSAGYLIILAGLSILTVWRIDTT